MWIVSFGEYPTKVGRKVPGTAATPNESARLGAHTSLQQFASNRTVGRDAHICAGILIY